MVKKELNFFNVREETLHSSHANPQKTLYHSQKTNFTAQSSTASHKRNLLYKKKREILSAPRDTFHFTRRPTKRKKKDSVAQYAAVATDISADAFPIRANVYSPQRVKVDLRAAARDLRGKIRRVVVGPRKFFHQRRDDFSRVEKDVFLSARACEIKGRVM